MAKRIAEGRRVRIVAALLMLCSARNETCTVSPQMAQSLSPWSTELVVAQRADLEPDLLDASSVTVLSIGLLLVSLIAVLVAQPWRKISLAPGSLRKPKHSAPPASKRSAPSRKSRIGSTNIEPGASGRPRRRVIRLHAVTPGQTPYEYNVGDGTTGSAPSRAA